MDSKDVKILKVLQANARMSVSQIAKKTLIPITTVHNRIKKFDREGWVKAYKTVLDPKAFDKDLFAFILVSTTYNFKGKKLSQESFCRRMSSFQFVQGVHVISGEWDVMLKLKVGGMEELNDFITKDLRPMQEVVHTRSIFVMDSFKETTDLL
ncbi:MAG: Lrp/AsnC family transcriptional regulator [Nanoarchaeota archaeon]|nr:Lrp/AsnC family transcriptional regulator [Nanoarchaeota archaeon]